MRIYIPGLLTALLLAGMASAQPYDGDLVIANFRDPVQNTENFGPGSIFSVNRTTGTVFTFSRRFTTIGTLNMGPNWIEMASDNTDLMVACLPTGASPTTPGDGVYFHRVDVRGSIVNTLIADPAPGLSYVNAFDLDYDGTWILAGGDSLWSYNEDSTTYATLYTIKYSVGLHNAFVIDRAYGGPEYVIGKFNSTPPWEPNLMAADRKGYVTTLSTAGPAYVSGVKIDRFTGDYISSAFGQGFNGWGGEFTRTTKTGINTTLNFPATIRMYRPNAIYLDKMHNAWLLTYDWQTGPIPTLTSKYVCALYKMDLQGVFLTLHTYASSLTRNVFMPAGITEYGCRHVVCNGSGKPGTSVKVLFSSRRKSEAGKIYQLAASFGYTGGIQMPSGEYLDLTFDVLLFYTANNLLPSIFQNFTGFLDPNGNAMANIHVPVNLPPGLGVTIFVSGVVLDPAAPGGIGSTGNTHWFVLN